MLIDDTDHTITAHSSSHIYNDPSPPQWTSGQALCIWSIQVINVAHCIVFHPRNQSASMLSFLWLNWIWNVHGTNSKCLPKRSSRTVSRTVVITVTFRAASRFTELYIAIIPISCS